MPPAADSPVATALRTLVAFGWNCCPAFFLGLTSEGVWEHPVGPNAAASQLSGEGHAEGLHQPSLGLSALPPKLSTGTGQRVLALTCGALQGLGPAHLKRPPPPACSFTNPPDFCRHLMRPAASGAQVAPQDMGLLFLDGCLLLNVVIRLESQQGRGAREGRQKGRRRGCRRDKLVRHRPLPC